MFSGWLPNALLPAKRRTDNLQGRINILMESNKAPSKTASPTLKFLQESRKQKVKRLSSQYEANIQSFNETSISNLSVTGMRKATSERSLAPPDASLRDQSTSMNRTFTKSLPDLSADCLTKLINMDAQFIFKMETLIKHYVKEFERFPGLSTDNAAVIEQRTRSVFPIGNIYYFHKHRFHPMLLNCKNLSVFASNVSVMCRNGSFNPYIAYAMDEQESEQRRSVYYKSFVDAVADKTGVPYDFEPIIQLQRYQNVIVEILSFLLDSGAPAEVVNRMTDAKFNWLDMMNRIYTMQELQ